MRRLRFCSWARSISFDSTGSSSDDHHSRYWARPESIVSLPASIQSSATCADGRLKSGPIMHPDDSRANAQAIDSRRAGQQSARERVRCGLATGEVRKLRAPIMLRPRTRDRKSNGTAGSVWVPVKQRQSRTGSWTGVSRQPSPAAPVGCSRPGRPLHECVGVEYGAATAHHPALDPLRRSRHGVEVEVGSVTRKRARNGQECCDRP